MARRITKPRQQANARRQIEQMIHAQGLWGERLAGERELAVALGVARGTLRQALVALEAEGVLHRRHGAGTFVCQQPSTGRGRASKARRIAVIAEGHFEREAGWHWAGEMIQGILRLAPRLGAECTVLALDAPAEAACIADASRMRHFDGFVSITCYEDGLLPRLLDLNRGPVVLVNHFVRDLPVIEVVDGSFEGARTVTRHLIALGHRGIAFLDCFDRNATNPEKYAGYRAALLERGLEFDPRLVACQPTPDDIDGFAEDAVDKLLSHRNPPTAIFAFDDFRALPAMAALERRGLLVGRDVSVAGCGDSAIRLGLCDRLTSSRVYWRRMGQEGLRAALAKHRRGEGRTIIVPNRLHIRQSTGHAARSSARPLTGSSGGS